MLKLVGAMLIVLATTMIGFRIAGSYRDRPRQLRQLIRALTHLQAEVEYQATPLPVALQTVAARCGQPCGSMFQRVSDHLLQDGLLVTEAFSRSLKQLCDESALKAGDCEPVQAIADRLSTMNRASLLTQFQLSVDSLRQAEQEARADGLRIARLWQYLGVLTGVMLVILLY